MCMPRSGVTNKEKPGFGKVNHLLDVLIDSLWTPGLLTPRPALCPLLHLLKEKMQVTFSGPIPSAHLVL